MTTRSQEPNTSQSARSQQPSTGRAAYEKGMRLACDACGALIEIANPCPCDRPDQVFLCCGRPMRPTTETSVHLGVE